MKKIALLFSKNIIDPTGASAVIRTIYNSLPLFKQNNIELSVYSRDIFKTSTTSGNGIPIGLINKLKYRFTKYLRTASRKNRLVASLNIYLGSIRPAKKIVQHYLSLNKNDEIIFVHEIFTCYEFIRQAKIPKKIIFVMHTNGDTYKMTRLYYKSIEKTLFYKYLLYIEKQVLMKVDRIGFVAELSSNNFIRLHPEIPRNNVFFVYNGLSLGEDKDIKEIKSRKSKDRIEICCTGTVNDRKGQRFIVEALIMNLGKLPNIHFSIIGEGNIKQELDRISKQHGIQEYITFYGTSNNVSYYLEKSDIFILPSKDEGLPISIIEAMRESLPIVSTKVGGIPEMIEEERTGIFIEPSSKGVSDFISQINSYDWKSMGEKSYQLFLKKFTVESMVNSYSHIMNLF